MKRFDYIVLPLLIVFAVFMGWKLAQGLNQAHPDVEVRALSSLDAFEKKADLTTKDSPDIYLLARQWQWNKEITLYSGRDYILHLASGDIQHSFHLAKQATGQSIDVLIQPGLEYLVKLRNLKPGIYPIGCTQYCGIEHNKMRSKLIVLE